MTKENVTIVNELSREISTFRVISNDPNRQEVVAIEEIGLNLLVILAVGAAAGIVLWLSARAKKKTRLLMEAYGAEHGYQTEEIRQRLHRATVIRGDGWRLSTGVKSSEVSTQSGSADTVAYTTWETVPDAPQNRPLLWFGTGAGDAARLKDGMLSLLPLLGIADMEGMHVVPLDDSSMNRFAAIAVDASASDCIAESLPSILMDWPADWPLRAVIGTDAVQLSVDGKRMRVPQELDRIIGLGVQCIDFRSAVMQYQNDKP
ncbi:MAG TPA: hypothetical protein PK537_08460 [Candidatus Limiplasma sp.]|nr:hypothetical protein [Candidatus Limiplasma sp.]